MTDALLPEVVALSSADFASGAAERIAVAIGRAIQARGECRLGLAGGGTPRPIYVALAEREDVDWSRVSVFFGDERAVGPQDEHSNYRMVRDVLLQPVTIADDRVFRVEGERPPLEARAAYEATLGEEPLDVLLLGMGGDGHTASVFPGPELDPLAPERVIVTQSPIPPTARISLSLRAINEAGQVVLLVAGSSKAARLAEVHQQMKDGAPALPAAHVAPHSGQLVWIVDRDAAAALSEIVRRK